MQIQHETIESIYTHDPNGYMIELTRPMRRMTPEEDLDANLTTQHTRSVNNDLTLVREQALLDVAVGMTFLRNQGFNSIVTLGHSGGGTLYAFYHEQAALPANQRLQTTPAGRPIPVADAEMPTADGAVFLAPTPAKASCCSAASTHRSLTKPTRSPSWPS